MEPVKIINPADGTVTEVPAESLPHHYRAGWRLLSDDEEKTADKPVPDPKPMTKAQAAKAAKSGNEE
jgi:hypothetical protein